MADLGGFDATKIDPAGDRTPLPAGEYRCIIESSDKKPTKAGTGAYLELVLQVIDGEQKGRKVWDRLNIWNPNADAARIASQTLSAICHAVGIMQPKASEQLHGIPLLVKVAVKERADRPGEYLNEVKGYTKIGGATTQPAMAATSAADKAPWE